MYTLFPATLFFQIDMCGGTSGWFSGGVYPCVSEFVYACYDSVVDDPQLSYYPVSSW
jgi:hypothetical protein